MIQPILQGATLTDDIRTSLVDPNEVCVWWLGQSGYVFKTASAVWYVDLYLSESLTQKYASTDKPHIRMSEAPLRGGDITTAEWVFSSHSHTDHFDKETLVPLFDVSSHAKLVLPAIQAEGAQKMGIPSERLMLTNGDETLQLGELTVHVIPSAHPNLDHSPEHGYPFVGFIFQVDGLTIYHSGDTVLYDGLVERLRQYAPDLLFLPINGARMFDGKPVVAPNLNASQAVELRQAVGTGMVIPHHYDMFTFNTADVNVFADLARSAHIPYAILRTGGIWRYRRA